MQQQLSGNDDHSKPNENFNTTKSESTWFILPLDYGKLLNQQNRYHSINETVSTQELPETGLPPPPEFPEPTSTEAYIIPTLGLHQGTFVFSYLSTFLSYITPYDLPVGKSDGATRRPAMGPDFQKVD